ncbi:MAG: 3-hydroxybutyryl-CoA dehydrogenase [Ignavibacteriales bacterium]|nr:MAG: 3-hydroxybutyryl-CoA dehydrogenase [Ignavibacteriaceae bacterium]MBW7872335.1 3-hydroxybutyryl-CoA dehydrogenase [Ignavibacteria bacterium]MCZ2142618.1 3-hydroxybutyryl-CoA dehydrogenase [Ignavibacteriales bacterium]OQY74576.1 MAG: 3-hydroxybutyryl-CoA dehydrogenase [Ignavibacteriales bacterium UTCHB3]MBV6445518.1 3-hydroxybutyryl-CoA dehydrogenase [Ignavibacteriaceae bacterium]
MDIKRVAVVGGGTMGNGIVTVFAINGYDVTLVETQQEFLERAIKNITSSLERMVKKETISEEVKSAALKNISTRIGVENVDPNTDLVVEAVYEDKGVKTSIFNKLDGLLKAESILASNTSSISITELAPKNRADKFIGMHFMNPVPVMKLVELIRGYSTSDDTYNAIKETTLKLNKVPVEVQDYPGFIANRILMPMINEAIYALMEGVATKEDIDSVMKLGMAHPMGPLTLADFIGLDVCLAIMTVIFDGYNDSKYRPCPLLKKMVAAGKLGRKSGEGFYRYE